MKTKKMILILPMLILVSLITSVIARADGIVLPSSATQIQLWRQANEKGKLGIATKEFASIPTAPILTKQDKQDGFVGVGLFYGFGNDGKGKADSIESGRISWHYVKLVYGKKQQLESYIHFKEKWMMLRSEALPRSRGFFWKKVNLLGKKSHFIDHNDCKCERVRDILEDTYQQIYPMRTDTGMSFEGIQLLGIIIPEYAEEMNGEDKPFIYLADYEIDPSGESRFLDGHYVPYLRWFDGKFLELGRENLDSVTDSEFSSAVLR